MAVVSKFLREPHVYAPTAPLAEHKIRKSYEICLNFLKNSHKMI